jgi:hypothetical protein
MISSRGGTLMSHHSHIKPFKGLAERFGWEVFN